MGLKENYDFEYLVNETERLVLDVLEQELAKDDKMCKCQDCILDMAAYALNHTAPNYRVSLLGKLYAGSAGSKYENEIKKAVKEAVKKVKKNPAHD